MSLLLALLALPVLALAAPVAIDLFFGEAFLGATDAVWALLPAAAAMAWWRALSAGLVRFSRARTVNAVAAAALLLNLMLNLLLIPPAGIAGAAIASLGSYTLGGLLAANQLRRFGLGGRAFFPGPDDVRRLVALLRAPLPSRARR
jgi:O-antigen/teichoic acid export membrane protein